MGGGEGSQTRVSTEIFLNFAKDGTFGGIDFNCAVFRRIFFLNFRKILYTFLYGIPYTFLYGIPYTYLYGIPYILYFFH